MARQKTGGRKKGTPNRKTQIVMDRLSELNCDPIEGMVTIAQQAMNAGDFALAGSMFKELAQYCYPKRKSIDHAVTTGDNDHFYIEYKPDPSDND